MGDEQKEGQASGEAVQPKASIPTDTENRASAIVEAIRKAREKRPVESGKEALIREAIDKSDTEEMRRAIGLDIPFDVLTLLTRGIVEQRGMKIAEDMYIDMHTLSKAEDILAERLVEEFNGPMQLSNAYVEAKKVAVLSIAITRVNRDRFPVPDLDPAKRMTDDWKTDWDLKRGLTRMLSAMTVGDINVLSLVYANLDKMDILIEEEAKKKSS